MQEKHKALSSETADRLTGLLRPAETNILRQSKGDEERERGMERETGERERGTNRTEKRCKHLEHVQLVHCIKALWPL